MSTQAATAELSHQPEASSPTDSIHETKDSHLQSAVQADDDIDNLSEEERAALEKSLKKKLDWQIVPLCLMLYLLSFLDRYVFSQLLIRNLRLVYSVLVLIFSLFLLDRTNIGQARLNGLEKDLHMSKDGKDYRIALTVLYVPYILFEIPSNLVVKRFGPARWIPFLVASWGLVSTFQGLVTNKTGLYINRAFLGLTEAGILPALAVSPPYSNIPAFLEPKMVSIYFGFSDEAGL